MADKCPFNQGDLLVLGEQHPNWKKWANYVWRVEHIRRDGSEMKLKAIQHGATGHTFYTGVFGSYVLKEAHHQDLSDYAKYYSAITE